MPLFGSAYPEYLDHADVICFRCERKISVITAVKSAYPVGRGNWYKRCPHCGMTTYYDIKGK